MNSPWFGPVILTLLSLLLTSYNEVKLLIKLFFKSMINFSRISNYYKTYRPIRSLKKIAYLLIAYKHVIVIKFPFTKHNKQVLAKNISTQKNKNTYEVAGQKPFKKRVLVFFSYLSLNRKSSD